ncbi:M48 family metalloprotease [Leptolyngbya sp. 15MV]|nr:M48 family metalloprotease [Leptolyngbya sp. 15MV]
MTAMVNNVKTAVLLAGLMGLFLVVGSQFGQQGLIMALVLGGAMNVVAWFFSDKIAIAAMRGHPVTQADNPMLYNMVDELRQRAGLPMPKVYICPQAAPNAFATGRSPAKGAVAVTEGLLQMLDRRELEGVIAHELAHIKNRDTLTSCIAATIAGVLAFLAQWGFMLAGNRNGGNPTIEWFQVGDRLLANEMAPRVHNSGHWTIEGAACSQFENHLRAITGLPLGSTEMRCPSAVAGMVNLIGRAPEVGELAALWRSHPHLYGKLPRAGRKIGHVTLIEHDEAALHARLAEVVRRVASPR